MHQQYSELNSTLQPPLRSVFHFVGVYVVQLHYRNEIVAVPLWLITTTQALFSFKFIPQNKLHLDVHRTSYAPTKSRRLRRAGVTTILGAMCICSL
jgi:hypothetical protein